MMNAHKTLPPTWLAAAKSGLGSTRMAGKRGRSRRSRGSRSEPRERPPKRAAAALFEYRNRLCVACKAAGRDPERDSHVRECRQKHGHVAPPWDAPEAASSPWVAQGAEAARDARRRAPRAAVESAQTDVEPAAESDAAESDAAESSESESDDESESESESETESDSDGEAECDDENAAADAAAASPGAAAEIQYHLISAAHGQLLPIALALLGLVLGVSLN